jgi:ribokinase
MMRSEEVLTGSVIVVGSVTMDLTVYSVNDPALGETVLGESFLQVPGGKGGNQAISASMAGGDVYLVSCVGSDAFSIEVKAALAGHGVNTDFVSSVQGQTGVAHIRVDHSGQNSIVVVPLANSELTTAHIDEAFKRIDAPRILLTQLEVRLEVAEYAIRKASAAGLKIILDPAPARRMDETIWPLIDIVTPNESEAFTITGVEVVDIQSALSAGRWFNERGVEFAIITMAENGALVVWEDGHRIFAPMPVEAVDTTAAGDAFSGYLGAQLALGAELEQAVEHAVVAGAIAVTRRGASSSLPRKEDVREALRRLSNK